jgi:hypothetical protein
MGGLPFSWKVVESFRFHATPIPGWPTQRMRSDQLLNFLRWGCTGQILTRIYRSADCYEIIPNANQPRHIQWRVTTLFAFGLPTPPWMSLASQD